MAVELKFKFKPNFKFVKPSKNLEQINQELKALTNTRISGIDKTTKEGRKLVDQIYKAKQARSAGSKAELAFMQAHPELGVKLKSGNISFSSPEAVAGLDAARLAAYKELGYGLGTKESIQRRMKKVGSGAKDLGVKTKGILSIIGGNNKLRIAEKTFNKKHPFLRFIVKDPLKYGMLLSGAGLTYGALNGTGWTNTILDVAGNQTRKDDGTPIFTVNRDFDDMSSNAQAFLQDAIDKKVIPGKWSTPEEREKYFQEHPNDTIRTGWYGRLNKELRKKGIKESDYKKYYGIDYGSLGDMPGLTGFGINIARGDDNKPKRFDPVTAGLYETQQSMGSFPLAFTKDGVLTDGESWDFKEDDKNAAYDSYNPLKILRVWAGRHGTNEKDKVKPIVTSNMKIPYKKRDK